jgi:hypothetical protein
MNAEGGQSGMHDESTCSERAYFLFPFSLVPCSLAFLLWPAPAFFFRLPFFAHLIVKVVVAGGGSQEPGWWAWTGAGKNAGIGGGKKGLKGVEFRFRGRRELGH